MARSGAFLVFASFFQIFKGFKKLWGKEKYFEFYSLLTIYFAVSIFLFCGFKYSWILGTPDMRVWAVMPFGFLSIFYVLSGPFVDDYVQNVFSKKSSGTRRIYLKIRALGGVVFLFGIGIWLYGFIHLFKGLAFIGLLLFPWPAWGLEFNMRLPEREV